MAFQTLDYRVSLIPQRGIETGKIADATGKLCWQTVSWWQWFGKAYRVKTRPATLAEVEAIIPPQMRSGEEWPVNRRKGDIKTPQRRFSDMAIFNPPPPKCSCSVCRKAILADTKRAIARAKRLARKPRRKPACRKK